MSRSANGAVIVWVIACCLLVFCMIVVGGVTRLTQSGLSMVDWAPLMGVVPPLTEAEWQQSFLRYQEFPEYLTVNNEMSLAGYKRIFYVEYAHRVLGRLLGLVFLLPFLVFLFTRRLNRSLALKLCLLFLLGAAQGLLGWYMVQSGLIDIPRVSPYRLTAHLMLAVLIFSGFLWILFDLFRAGTSNPSVPKAIWFYIRVILVVVIGMIFSGGFVAGTRAGFVFNTFPKMYDQWIPQGIWAMQPGWVNVFENVATVQFIHRGVAMILLVLSLGLWLAVRNCDFSLLKRCTSGLLLIVMVQVGLGISTLLLFVPVSLAAVHQAGAMVVFAMVLFLCHMTSRSA